MAELTPTPRTALKRRPQRASYERAQIDAILDEALVCHVGFVHGGTARVIPTVYGRAGDALFLHGAASNRMLRSLVAPGVTSSLCVTLLDGLVMARSAFHTSVNYRSVVLYAQAEPIEDPGGKLEALRVVVEHIAKGRWDDVRRPSREELARTSVLRFPIVEGSAKVRSGGPIEDEADYALPCWAGVVPVRTSFAPPIADERLGAGVAVPEALARYTRGAPR